MMMTAFELNTFIYKLLAGHTSINGGVYYDDDRPNDSQNEDIVVNTIDVTMDSSPQLATSNVNIYVPDTAKIIDGSSQLKANRTRLRELTKEIICLLKNAQFVGIKLIVVNHNIISETNINQHYSNIRINWNIQT